MLTDILRIAIGASVLAFAAVADLRWRRAPDICWFIAGGAGALLLLADILDEPSALADLAPSLAVAGFLFVAALAVYFLGLIAGGADAKAIAALALLVPAPLADGWDLPLDSPFPLALTVLVNALVLALAVPIVLLVLNLVRGDVDGFRTLLAVRRPVRDVDPRVVWPLEYIDEDGNHVKRLTPRGVPLDAFDPEALAARGIDRVWVTPKVPFLVPLFAGFVVAVLVGDPLAVALERFMAPG